MSKRLTEQIAHGAHIALHTETGKHLAKAAMVTAVGLTSTVVGAAAAPFVVAGALGYGLWRLCKN